MGNWLEALQGLQEGSTIAGQQIGQGTLARERRDTAQKKAAEDADHRNRLDLANQEIQAQIEANNFEPLPPHIGLDILSGVGLGPEDWDPYFKSGLIQRPAVPEETKPGKPGKPAAIANAIPGHPGYYYDPETGQARRIEGLPAPKEKGKPTSEKRLEDMSVEELTKLLREFEPMAYQNEAGKWVVEEGDIRNPARRQKIQELIQQKMGMRADPYGLGAVGKVPWAQDAGGKADGASGKKDYSNLWK